MIRGLEPFSKQTPRNLRRDLLDIFDRALQLDIEVCCQAGKFEWTSCLAQGRIRFSSDEMELVSGEGRDRWRDQVVWLTLAPGLLKRGGRHVDTSDREEILVKMEVSCQLSPIRCR